MSSLIAPAILAHLRFMAEGHKLPTVASWKQPSGSPAGDHYPRSLKPADMVAIPSCFPPQFFPQNPQRYHQKSCDDVGNQFKDFMSDAIDGIKFAHNMWKMRAKFQDLKVNAVTALGMPGCLDGPGMENLIKYSPSCAMMSGNMGKYRDAVAKGVGDCYKNWQDMVTVPGLPWYPAFAAFPGPQAPPMPNVPMPLIACISPMTTEIALPFSMASGMAGALDGGLKQNDPDKQYQTVFDSIADVCALGFAIWLVAQQVMLVMGKGPIPTFAPPFVPVGPVVMGDNIAAPGHLAE